MTDDKHIQFLGLYSPKQNYEAVVQLFQKAIIQSAISTFYLLLPLIDYKTKIQSLEIIVKHGNLEMMKAIHGGKPFNVSCLTYTNHPLWMAVSFDQYEMAKLLLEELGYVWKHEISLYHAVVHVNLNMLKLLHEHNLTDKISDMLMYTLRHILCSEGSAIYPLNPDNYDAESIEYLFFLHENYPIQFSGEYKWECNTGQECYFCQESLRRK